MPSTKITITAAEVVGLILANQRISDDTVKLGTEILAVDGCPAPIPLRAKFILRVERQPLPNVEVR